ncbi:hypothetical protein AYI68_g6978 [Smittium mucronatum]|uniref:Uncharacterized protein n=1 Tax=Smittium mucronatum TaxID=133383 RepID=A0A1R0GPZ7_9FUNG|nr:hypothetical protein AYI68_g6978 [Smittium mucronatum]
MKDKREDSKDDSRVSGEKNAKIQKTEFLEIEPENRSANIFKLTPDETQNKEVNNLVPKQNEKKTFEIKPPSELLSRIANFLPLLKQENEKLEQSLTSNPETLNIENIGEDETQFIEMDLNLGIFDVNGKVPTSLKSVEVSALPEEKPYDSDVVDNRENYLSGNPGTGPSEFLKISDAPQIKPKKRVIEVLKDNIPE